jgi:hypothetical protein
MLFLYLFCDVLKIPSAIVSSVFVSSFIYVSALIIGPIIDPLASNGLGVIGGDTVNLVGLGGCVADGRPHSLYNPWAVYKQNIHPLDFVENLPNYCARGVLRNPTMWVGIFTGG